MGPFHEGFNLFDHRLKRGGGLADVGQQGLCVGRHLGCVLIDAGAEAFFPHGGHERHRDTQVLGDLFVIPVTGIADGLSHIVFVDLLEDQVTLIPGHGSGRRGCAC